MICYVDIEHEKALQSAEERAIHQARCADVKLKLEGISGDVCLVQHYKRITQQWLEELEIRALIIGGNTTEWAEYDKVDLLKMFHIIRDTAPRILRRLQPHRHGPRSVSWPHPPAGGKGGGSV